ncbi:DUF6503 family protein [Zobellia alginiliquefaciens]|uniref:DUF6503 family protein n=1 Tax=Zobellia alginiliquefaciens TaxID=3032586 RepID=UPI0023E4751B|nr:DUF6503 family protein [Zobellia alginiliquefaciens]
MKAKHLFILVLSFFFSIACKEEKKDSSKTTTDSTPVSNTDTTETISLLDRCIAAHGGIDVWNSFTALSYTVTEKGREVKQLTNIKDRRAYLKSKDFEVGFDGKTAWAFPDVSKIPGKSASFYYNLDFYFIGIPFLLKDPGVIATDEGNSVVNGKSYETLKITFGSEIGLTPEDIYYLYIDPETSRLEILTYSVSFFDKDNAGINSAKVYSNYKEVQGIMIPTKLENFKWKNNEMGESTNHIRLVSDIQFLDTIADTTVFEIREDAITEEIN